MPLGTSVVIRGPGEKQIGNEAVGNYVALGCADAALVAFGICTDSAAEFRLDFGVGLLLLQPSLEHQHSPELRLPIAAAAHVFVPLLANRLRIEVAFALQARFVEKIFGPRTHRAAQPFVNRHAEALLRPIDQLLRHVAVEQVAQRALCRVCL